MLQAPLLVHAGSPPPLAVAVLLPPLGRSARLLATLTGTVTTMSPLGAPLAIWQLAPRLEPLVGQPLKVPVPEVMVGAPLRVMPVGRMSVKVSAAVLGPPAMRTVRA
jgi:hypothetical protein